MEMKPGNTCTGQRDELATGRSCCTRDKDGDVWSEAYGIGLSHVSQVDENTL